MSITVIREGMNMNKKQLIMEKALELFADKGFEATSVQQITDYSGISKGAFYLSFKSKEELILALIDHFMTQIVTDIDYEVKNSRNTEDLLYDFYFTTFHSTQKHSDFAKILRKEETQPFNKELIHKIQYFDEMIENSILTMVEKLYGEEITETKYDLVYCIKGFISIYSHLLLFHNVPVDLKLLSQSLVEKTDILAHHTTVPFISQELMQMVKQPMTEEVSKDQIIDMIDQKLAEIEESFEKESLILLREELLEPTLSDVIVKGLIENIRLHPHCKWISYLLRSYFKI